MDHALTLEPGLSLSVDLGSSSRESSREEEDLVLAAIARAPIVEISDEEAEDLYAIEAQTTRWIPHDDVVSSLSARNHP
jgi:hypothetical protein